MSDLQGENLIASFKEAAQRIVARISRIDSVTGIVLQGALVRGFADRFSDVDITTFITSQVKDVRRVVQEIGNAEQRSCGLEVDLEVHDLDHFRNEKWTEIRRWDFYNSEVAYDPKGSVREMIAEKVNVSSTFWLRRVVVSSVYASWYCCPVEEGQSTLLDVAISRGDLLSAHYYVNYGVELLLQVLFAANHEFLPPPKWRMFYSRKLNWLPSDFNERVALTMIVNELSASDLDRRAICLRQLWSEARSRLEQSMSLSHEKAVKYYVTKILKQQA